MSLQVDIFPDTAFPVAEIRELLQSRPTQRHVIDLAFCNAEAERLNTSDDGSPESGKFIINSGHHDMVEICFKIHSLGGRERFQNDAILLHRLLLETGGIERIGWCHAFTSTCCDDYVGEAIALFASSCHTDNYCFSLSDRDGDANPDNVKKIVDGCCTWRTTNLFWWESKNFVLHHHSLQEAFSKRCLQSLRLSTPRTTTMDHDVLALIAACIRSSNQCLVLNSLFLQKIPVNARSDALVADIIAASNGTNMKTIEVTYDTPDWIAKETTQAMRDSNHTLFRVRIHPFPKDLSPLDVVSEPFPPAGDKEVMKTWTQQKLWALEIHFFEALNRAGRGAMCGGTAIPPDVLLAVIDVASIRERDLRLHYERKVDGYYLFPILVESVSGWIGYAVEGKNSPAGGDGQGLAGDQRNNNKSAAMVADNNISLANSNTQADRAIHECRAMILATKASLVN